MISFWMCDCVAGRIVDIYVYILLGHMAMGNLAQQKYTAS